MTTPSDPSSGPDRDPESGGRAPGGDRPLGWDSAPPWPAYDDGSPPGWGPPPSPWSQVQSSGHHGAGPQSGEDTTWAVLAHLSYFVLGLIAPLVIYLVKKDSSPFVRQQAAEALNFHLTLTIAFVVSAILVIVLIGLLLLVAVFLVGAVFAVLAAIAAGRGQPYRYPMTIRFVS